MCLNDDGLRAGAAGTPTDQGGLLGQNLSPAGPVSVVVVVQSGQGDLVSGLQASEVFYQIVDHTNVFTVQIWLEEVSLLVLEISHHVNDNMYCRYFMYYFIIFVAYICITFTIPHSQVDK